MTTTDDLAAELQKLVNAILGYKNCPTLKAMVDNALPVLAQYRHEQELLAPLQMELRCQRWVRTQNERVWLEWIPVEAKIFHLWLQERHPDVWREWVKGQ